VPAVVYAAAVFVALHATGRHRLRICLRLFDEIGLIVASALVPVILLLPWLRSGDQVRRIVLLVATSTFLLLTGRAVLYAVLRAAHRAGRLTDATLIVGTADRARDLGDLMLRHGELGLRPVGLVGDVMAAPDVVTSAAVPAEAVLADAMSADVITAEGPSLPVLGDLAATPDVIREYRVRRLIVAEAGADDDVITMLRADCPLGVAAYLVPQLSELARAVPAGYRDEIWGTPVAALRRCGLRRPQRVLKRGFDLAIACALVVLLAPILLVLVVAELATCGRPVLFKQDRVTYAGRIMRIMKFRTISRPVNPDSQWTVDAADCSPIGHWLRATHCDELPQLFNVIRGDMSLVGPRPERPFFTAQFGAQVPHYEDRHRTPTGVTGWAQVHGLTGDTSIPERIRFDNYYIEHWSLWLDISILFRTLTEPLAGALRVRRSRRAGEADPPR
jgi:lipopolysaccharide/colanic/teichoic acid biosynthesis glycosyltransferase